MRFDVLKFLKEIMQCCLFDFLRTVLFIDFHLNLFSNVLLLVSLLLVTVIRYNKFVFNNVHLNLLRTITIFIFLYPL